MVKAANLIAEEHHAEGRGQQTILVQCGRGGIGLPPIDIGMPAALARLLPSASIGPEMSNPTTRRRKMKEAAAEAIYLALMSAPIMRLTSRARTLLWCSASLANGSRYLGSVARSRMISHSAICA
jgi:hypothetical protein